MWSSGLELRGGGSSLKSGCSFCLPEVRSCSGSESKLQSNSVTFLVGQTAVVVLKVCVGSRGVAALHTWFVVPQASMYPKNPSSKYFSVSSPGIAFTILGTRPSVPDCPHRTEQNFGVRVVAMYRLHSSSFFGITL